MRRILAIAFAIIFAVHANSESIVTFSAVKPGYEITFPADTGAHPEFRTEWWYVTGWLSIADAHDLGFQITFFRARPDNIANDNPSRFAPKQILFAHVALSDPLQQKHFHAERIARAGMELAEAKTGSLNVWIDDWQLREHSNRYVTRIDAQDFAFDFEFEMTQPPLLNGERGYSQKSPNPLAASYYYSIPQLKVSGALTRHGKRENVTGVAWFDHEWSSEYMDARAAGWDWAGINFDDGAALMAFRMRDKNGNALWAGGSYRSAAGDLRILRPEEIEFTPARLWRSPRTAATYPIALQLRAGENRWTLTPLIDDQELNSSSSGARANYWEGAVFATQNGKRIGRGYLELTGYAKAMKF